MPPDEPRIGAHLPLGTGMVRAANRAVEIGATAIQVFVDNPTAWRRRAAPPRALPAFREILARHDIAPLAVHAAYLVNLAGPEREFAAKSREILMADLRAAPGYGARFVNVHTGSHRETTLGAGIRRVAKAIAATLEAVEDGPDAPMLILENSAGGGSAVGTSVAELARIADWAEKLGVPEHRLGFCLDTAHAWGAGIRVDEPRAIDRLLDEFERRIGLRRLVLVHFNDSRSEVGSRRDRHEHVGAGRIGEGGMGHLIRHPALRHAAFVMETPGMDLGYDLINIERARDLLAGRKLRHVAAGGLQDPGQPLAGRGAGTPGGRGPRGGVRGSRRGRATLTNQGRPSRPDRPDPGGSVGRARGHTAVGRTEGTLVQPDALRVGRQPILPPDGGRRGDGLLGRAGRAVWRVLGALVRHDRIVLGGLLVAAALLRLVGLATRGRFDGDQGHDALVLLRLVRDGVVPLLGPPTSIGDFHHGAVYYYLLAPIAFLTDADPTAIVSWLAVLGVAAVAATWWFARMVGGRVTAAIAATLMAVSPASIEESTFIWNPNPIPLFAAFAMGAAWRAHSTGRARWWLLAIVAAGVVVQLHVLGIVFLPPILALAVVDVVRARRAGDTARVSATLQAVGGGLLLAALLFVPLLVHELGHDFEETRRVLDYLTGGARESAIDPFIGAVITLFRIIGWPLVGLVTDSPSAAIVTVSAVSILGLWLLFAARGPERLVARWLVLTIAWSGLALTLVAPSLQTVVEGLPNDHYHAYIDPLVFVIVGLAARALTVGSGPRQRVDSAARTVVVAALAGLVLLDLRLAPPPDPNGGWPAAERAGARIAKVAADPIDIRQLPLFKTAEGVAFPVIRAGRDVLVATDQAEAIRPVQAGATLVIACDRLFEAVMLATCGGSAEEGYLRQLYPGRPIPTRVERIDLSPRIVVSIYRP